MDELRDAPLAPLPAGVELELHKPSWAQNKHVLVAGSQAVGRYDRRNVSDQGSAEATTGAWTFARSGGLLSTKLGVLDAATGAELAEYATSFFGRRGTLGFADGSGAYDLRPRGFGDGRWTWTRVGDDEPVAALRLKSFGEVKATAELFPGAAQDRHGALLVLFGCHVAMRSRRQASAAAAS